MERYESAIENLKRNGLYSSTVAMALRAEFRRQCNNNFNRKLDKVESEDFIDNTDTFQNDWK